MKFLVVIGLVMLINTTVDFNNPAVMNIVRTLFVGMNVAMYFLWTTIKTKVETSPSGDTRIWIKKAAAAGVGGLLNKFFGEDPNAVAEYEETTYRAVETKKIEQHLQQAIMGPLMNVAMSMFMGLHLPLALQLVLTPWNALDEPLIKKYILGSTAPALYGEKLQDPTAPAPAQQLSDAASSSGAAPGDDVECEEAIFRAWESSEPTEMGMFEHLGTKGKQIATYQTSEHRWSALMVVAGSKQNGKKEVLRLLELGCNPSLQDADGWTALHWAAYHDCAPAIEAICKSYSDAYVEGVKTAPGKAAIIGNVSQLATLLALKDKDGKTALDIARREKASACEAALVAAGQRTDSVATSASAAAE